jgi:hypothetical protein
MQPYHTAAIGHGRTRVELGVMFQGEDLLVTLANSGPHIGAVALSEYDAENSRVSTSVVTRLGHKDDALARMAAERISRATGRTICAVAGIHVERISNQEIQTVLDNAGWLVDEFCAASG